MSHYAAVTDAFRMAEKQNTLIREVMRLRAEKADAQKQQPVADKKRSEKPAATK